MSDLRRELGRSIDVEVGIYSVFPHRRQFGWRVGHGEPRVWSNDD